MEKINYTEVAIVSVLANSRIGMETILTTKNMLFLKILYRIIIG